MRSTDSFYANLSQFLVCEIKILPQQEMACEGKTVGKPQFQHQGKANTQSRIMIANHAARNSKRVGLARELGNMTASGKEFQNIQDMLNNQMDEVSKHQHKDLQGMARKSKNFGKPHFQLRDEVDTQPRVEFANHEARNLKKRVGLARELGNMAASGKECQNIRGMLNNKMDKASKQQHNDVQGMTLKSKNVGKYHFQLQDEANTQPRILIANHTTRNSKERDCQNIQGASNNQIDEASNQKDAELQGLTSRITFNDTHVENDLMDEEYDQDLDIESESSDAEKKTRGPTFMKEIWGRPSTLPRIKIQCDGMGCPIGSRRNKFTDFLGTLARNGKFCPIDVEDWHKMPLDNKKTMLDVIKEKYDLPLGTESWTLRSIAKKWRNWKLELKKKYYDPELSMQVLLHKRDKRAFVEQYVKLVAQWNSEKSKRKEKGRPASRVELFHTCFTHANGSPSSNIVAEKLAAMKELENQLPEDEDDQVGQNDIFAQIIGPDRPGRVRMLGDGVNPSDLWGEVPSRSTCNRIVMEQKTKLEKMEEQIRKQGQHIAMLKSKICNQPNQNLVSNCNSIQHTSSSSSPLLSDRASLSLKIGCSVLIKSLFDSMKIVAKGVLRSMDPITEVGRQVLGPNWCEIQVLVVVEREESLIRPYDLLQRFEDALGGMIAWLVIC